MFFWSLINYSTTQWVVGYMTLFIRIVYFFLYIFFDQHTGCNEAYVPLSVSKTWFMHCFGIICFLFPTLTLWTLIIWRCIFDMGLLQGSRFWDQKRAWNCTDICFKVQRSLAFCWPSTLHSKVCDLSDTATFRTSLGASWHF